MPPGYALLPATDAEDRGTPCDIIAYSIAASASTQTTPEGRLSELPPGVGPRYTDTTPPGVVHCTPGTENGLTSQVQGGLEMPSILIAHHDQAFSQQLTPSSAKAAIT